MPNPAGKILIIAGLIIAGIGIIVYFKNSIPFLKYLGRLPGDIVINKENIKIYFPLATSIILSILLSLILFLFNKMR